MYCSNKARRCFFQGKDKTVLASGCNFDYCLGLNGGFEPRTRPIQLNNFSSEIKRASFGSAFGFILNSDQQLFLTGTECTFGPKRMQPALVCNKLIIQADCGDDFIVVIDNEHNAWSMGENQCGQLGIGRFVALHTLQKVSINVQVMNISCGLDHSLLLDEQGCIWGFGRNHLGQLGTGDTRNSNKPKLVENIPPITMVGTGSYFSVILDTYGNVWTTGCNSSGELGAITNTMNYRVDFNQINVPNDTVFCSISVGSNHTLVLDSAKNAWGFGRNTNHELGVEDKPICEVIQRLSADLVNISYQSAGVTESMWLNSDEDILWVVGKNGKGVLGLGHGEPVKKPQAISSFVCMNNFDGRRVKSARK